MFNSFSPLNNNMSIAAKLISSYNVELMGHEKVRNLVRSVAQDPQNETVDLLKSAQTVRAVPLEDGGAARRAIVAWLNDVFFSNKDLPDYWWFEMHTRIRKLLVVSMVLEGDNLRSFGVEKPDVTDIPQCLVYLWAKLDELAERFAMLRSIHVDQVRKVGATQQGMAFLSLYTMKPN